MVAQKPPLQQNRLLQLSYFLQEIKILHISRADLDDVDICKQGDLPHICDFGDNGKPRCLLGLHQDFHSGSAQTLKIVGRGSGLKCAAPEHVGAGVLNRPGGAEHLLVCFHGTGAGNQAEMPAPI